MPHVVIEGDVDLEEYARSFEPILIRNGRDVIRASTLYRDQSGRALLLEALVIESGRKLPFYLKLTAHDRESATVRVDPLTHPDPSEGVHTLVSRVASDLVELTPGARVRSSSVLVPSALGHKGDSQ